MHSILYNLQDELQKSLDRVTIDYLKQRGIKKSTALEWGIGHLPSEELILNLEGDKEILYEKGILLRRVDKSPLSGYITFPMRNQYGEIIGFSGRPPLTNQEVKIKGLKKYWHSRFDKKRFLFGLDLAVSSIREKGYVIITEGQFDTITASQSDVKNIVSTCGTALTDEQIIILSRYTSDIRVVFDNDDAGKAAIEQLGKHKRSDLKIFPIYLPDSMDLNGNIIKEDPDSYIKKFGRDSFLKIVEGVENG